MKTNFLGIFFGLVSAAIAGTTPTGRATADARVSVVFLHPETYTDAGAQRSERERNGILRDLGGAMQGAAMGYLREGLQLEIQVRDIDLAGDVESWRGCNSAGSASCATCIHRA